MHKSHVAIIGGGCAGLSAAAALVDRGYSVTLFEAGSQLGGRARTVAVETNGLLHLLDNGQHILLGAYQETLALLKKVGVNKKKAFLRVPLQINMQSSTAKSVFSLKSFNLLPAPFNLLFGLLFCKGISFKERMAALKFMQGLKNTQYQIVRDLPLERFLSNQHQSKRLISFLWEPLCLAALNTPIAKASTRIFLNVLRDTFSGNKKNSDFLLPRLDLSQIISEPLLHYIQTKGGTIKLNQRVRRIEVEGNGFNIETRYEKTHFSHVIIAVSPARVEKLIATLPKLNHAIEQTQTYQYQPIYTVYLQYPPGTSLPSVISGLSGSIGQWVFDRGQLCDQQNLISVIVSAEGKHQQLTQDELALRVAKELNRAFPALSKPLWHKVIAEKRATFSCEPNLERPTNKTSQPNVFLAGDYTYPEYPATIEGAIRSGIYCANLIHNS
jgi:squalene-associated FAD-dependent desaturase